MTFQGDQQSIVSESGSAEDGLVSVRATSIRPERATARRGLSYARRRRRYRKAARVTSVRRCPTRWSVVFFGFWPSRSFFDSSFAICSFSATFSVTRVFSFSDLLRTTEQRKNSSAIYSV